MPLPLGEEVELCVGGKLNLYLGVVGKSGDYHLIETVFQSIDLYDRLKVRIGGEGIEVICDSKDVPSGKGNLVWRAVHLFRERFGIKEGVVVHLEKRIPIGRGLGGGSADAGATLLALARLFDVERDEILALAPCLGADVSFFLYGGCAVGKGKGEIIEPLNFLPPFSFLLLIPPFSLSTALVYSRLSPPYPPSTLKEFLGILRRGDMEGIATVLRNDLEQPAFSLCPELAEVKREMMAKGYPTLMTGSGSALFSIFRDEVPRFEREGWRTVIVNPTSWVVKWKI